MDEDALKPSEYEKVFKWVESLLGFDVPHWVKVPLAVLLLLALIASVTLVVVAAISKIQELCLEKIFPRLYNLEERQRSRSRRLFAQHLAREIESINASENWRDDEFTELEAEVEAEGERRSFLPIYRKQGGIRRERSLTVALARSTERLVLLEGEPGSGKSVALRHAGLNLALMASRSARLDSILPVYVNLKALRRDHGTPVTRELIRSHVLRSMNRINDRFVDEFINMNFDQGVKNGEWYFLFDSFDEIPDVLSSIEADAVVEQYTNAIADFLSGLNSCRAVVASRFYRGPEAHGWRKFRVVELSPRSQKQLVSKALLVKSSLVEGMLGDLQNAPSDVRNMASNPLLLGLLCEHVRLGYRFPSTSFEVYSKYISERLKRDAVRVAERFAIEIDEVRQIAEEMAFSITADRQIGLSPRRTELLAALTRQQFERSPDDVIQTLDALEYMKLGKRDNSDRASDPQFSFAHRRFQEYFATSIVIREPSRLAPQQLLLDARWRETAVVICQTSKDSDAAPLLEEAAYFLSPTKQEISFEPIIYLSEKRRFSWRPGTIHIMGILQDGYSARLHALPNNVRDFASKIVSAAFFNGDFLDRKFALEVAGILPKDDLLKILRAGVSIDSQVINDVLYRQVARLEVLPDDLMEALRTTLLRLTFERRSTRYNESINAFVRRVPQAPQLADAARLAFWIGPISLILTTMAASPLLYVMSPFGVVCGVLVVGGATILYIRNYFTYSKEFLSFVRFQTSVLFAMALLLDLILSERSVGLDDHMPPPSNWIRNLYGLGLYSLHSMTHASYVILLGCVGALYGSAWPGAAIAAVKSGELLRPYSWLIIPLPNVSRLSRSFFSGWRSWPVLLFGIIVSSSFIYLFTMSWMCRAILGAATAPFLLQRAVLNARGCFRFSSDMLIIWRWPNIVDGDVSAIELVRLYNQLRTEAGRAFLLERVHRRGPVKKNASDSDLVVKLVLDIDARISEEKTEMAPSSKGGLLYRVVRMLFLPAAKLDWSLSKRHLANQRDSLYLMLEAARRAEVSETNAEIPIRV